MTAKLQKISVRRRKRLIRKRRRTVSTILHCYPDRKGQLQILKTKPACPLCVISRIVLSLIDEYS